MSLKMSSNKEADKAEIQKKLSSEIEKMTSLRKDGQKLLNSKIILDGQFSENEVVKEELDFLGPDNPVYKLTGPVMIPYDLEEAKQNVSKRMDYINGELKRIKESLEDVFEKQDKQGKLIGQLEARLNGAEGIPTAAKS